MMLCDIQLMMHATRLCLSWGALMQYELGVEV